MKSLFCYSDFPDLPFIFQFHLFDFVSFYFFISSLAMVVQVRLFVCPFSVLFFGTGVGFVFLREYPLQFTFTVYSLHFAVLFLFGRHGSAFCG